MLEELEDYITYLKVEKGLSKNSISSYELDLKDYVSYCDKTLHISSIQQVEVKDIENYLVLLHQRNLKSTSISRKITAIKNFHRYLLLNNTINRNVAENIEKPKLAKQLPKVLSEQEVDLLLDIPLETVFDYRNKAMLELLYGTGLRVSEMLDLKFSDIDLINCVIRCFGKRSKERIVPIGEYVLYYLQEYMVRRNELLKKGYSEYVFLNNHGGRLSRFSFFKIIKKILRDKGIKKDVSPHTLRHSFATHMIAHGADLRSVQELLGHTDISTTRIYTHVSNDKIKHDYEEYHPRSKRSK